MFLNKSLSHSYFHPISKDEEHFAQDLRERAKLKTCPSTLPISLFMPEKNQTNRLTELTLTIDS